MDSVVKMILEVIIKYLKDKGCSIIWADLNSIIFYYKKLTRVIYLKNISNTDESISKIITLSDPNFFNELNSYLASI